MGQEIPCGKFGNSRVATNILFLPRPEAKGLKMATILEFCNLIFLIMLSERQDLVLHLHFSFMKINQIVPDFEHSQEQNINK